LKDAPIVAGQTSFFVFLSTVDEAHKEYLYAEERKKHPKRSEVIVEALKS
jgi:hypothetical protein